MKTKQIKKIGAFYQMPKSVDGMELSINAKYLYMRLLDLTKITVSDKELGDNDICYCFCTIEKMAEYLGCGITTAKKVKKELINAGLLRTEKQKYSMADILHVELPESPKEKKDVNTSANAEHISDSYEQHDATDEAVAEQKSEDTEMAALYVNVVSYLNIKANTSYRPNSKKTRQLIKARFNEGFALDDFKKVIDNKTSEWLGSDMDKYLRPETLFGTKFESYLNQKQKQRSYLDQIPDYMPF